MNEMKLNDVVAWLDDTLKVKEFSDVSNNGLQISRTQCKVRKVAFGVDASVRFLEKAGAWGADLCVVHHGISWGGGIERITGGVYNVIKVAIEGGMALYGVHLPLDAHPVLGNNAVWAKKLGMTDTRKAFVYHGEVIGLIGTLPDGRRAGLCSGGGGTFAPEAKELGCDVMMVGEADWGEVIAAENAGIRLKTYGHYETEVYGVSALAEAMHAELGLETMFIPTK